MLGLKAHLLKSFGSSLDLANRSTCLPLNLWFEPAIANWSEKFEEMKSLTVRTKALGEHFSFHRNLWTAKEIRPRRPNRATVIGQVAGLKWKDERVAEKGCVFVAIKNWMWRFVVHKSLPIRHGQCVFRDAEKQHEESRRATQRLWVKTHSKRRLKITFPFNWTTQLVTPKSGESKENGKLPARRLSGRES